MNYDYQKDKKEVVDKWVIRCVSDKNLYWNINEGWMTTTIKNPDELNEYAEVYTNTERKINNLPIDGEWVRYTENK